MNSGHRAGEVGLFAAAPAASAGPPFHARDATDAELMALVGRGDEQCVVELQRRYRPMVVSYAATLLDADLAEDVAQDVFIRACAHAARWQPIGSLRAYLLRIARNLALNERRRAKARSFMLNAAQAVFARRRVATPADTFDEHELKSVIVAALSNMPTRRRDAFGLVRFGGLSYAEAASVMGTSPQTVANQVSAAMADLRRVIDPLAEGSA